MTEFPRLNRRTVLGAGAAGIVVVGAGGWGASRILSDSSAAEPLLIGPQSRRVATAEQARRSTGRTVTRTLTAAPARIDLGGRIVETWAYDETLPGPEIRVHAGDRLKVTVRNELPDSTTIHWHGLALRNDMDGVPTVTQGAIGSSGGFTYDFIVPDPGTYWFHPHVGVQLDTGLYAPLIVEDPAEPGNYDDEIVLVLDDWTHGVGPAPEEILSDFAANGMGSMSDMTMSSDVSPEDPLGTDTGDVTYPLHLINGRQPSAPHVVRSQPGRRLRLRIINAAADTAYRFAIGDHQLTVTHTDGFPVQPVTVDTLIIGMGERYDLTVDVLDGTHPIVASPEGKEDPTAVAVLTTNNSKPDRPVPIVPGLFRRLLTYDDLRALDSVALGPSTPDRELTVGLQMGGEGREWLINGQVFADREPLQVEPGERVRIAFKNESTMFHPMHVHGHTFGLATPSGTGARKDTVNVLPQTEMTVDLDASNPGQWLTHCHNIYHGELGMMTVLSYVEPR